MREGRGRVRVAAFGVCPRLWRCFFFGGCVEDFFCFAVKAFYQFCQPAALALVSFCLPVGLEKRSEVCLREQGTWLAVTRWLV